MDFSRASASQIIKHLKSLRNAGNVAGMSKFGINPDGLLGISIPVLRDIAKRIGKNHPLAIELWNSGIHEARMLAGFIDDAKLVGESQMEKWAKDFDSWDLCDQVCSNLFDKTEYAVRKGVDWTGREEEFVKRAGFVIMAALAVHDKTADDNLFLSFLPLIKRESSDSRNFVKKSVNWALRQIGKRNPRLNRAAVKLSREILKSDTASARWIAADAIRELTGEAVLRKFRNRT